MAVATPYLSAEAGSKSDDGLNFSHVGFPPQKRTPAVLITGAKLPVRFQASAGKA